MILLKLASSHLSQFIYKPYLVPYVHIAVNRTPKISQIYDNYVQIKFTYYMLIEYRDTYGNKYKMNHSYLGL